MFCSLSFLQQAGNKEERKERLDFHVDVLVCFRLLTTCYDQVTDHVFPPTTTKIYRELVVTYYVCIVVGGGPEPVVPGALAVRPGRACFVSTC